MLKFSKRSSEKNILKENKDCDKIFENIICQNGIPKINSIFSKHVLKCRRYYGIQLKKYTMSWSSWNMHVLLRNKFFFRHLVTCNMFTLFEELKQNFWKRFLLGDWVTTAAKCPHHWPFSAYLPWQYSYIP